MHLFSCFLQIIKADFHHTICFYILFHFSVRLASQHFFCTRNVLFYSCRLDLFKFHSVCHRSFYLFLIFCCLCKKKLCNSEYTFFISCFEYVVTLPHPETGYYIHSVLYTVSLLIPRHYHSDLFPVHKMRYEWSFLETTVRFQISSACSNKTF